MKNTKKITRSFLTVIMFSLLFLFNFSVSYGQSETDKGPIYGVVNNNQLYIWEGSGWRHIPNTGDITDIAVAKDGSILGVGTNTKMYIWVKTELYSAWEEIPNSQGIVAIAIKH